MTWVLVFLFGLCVGSFINCLVYRINKDKGGLRGIFWGRSFCDKCHRQLVWYDNIPLLSFVMLRGRCRFCHSPIPWQYPLVELTTGILTVIVYLMSVAQIFNFQFSIYNLFITYALIAIFVSDLRYNTIPNQIVYPAILFSLGSHFLSFSNYHATVRGSNVVYFILSGLGAAGSFLLLVILTRGKGMGMGDVKLAGLMGLVLGFPKILVALFLAFLTGAVWGVILVVMGKKKLKSHIPFGPFLTGATLISLVWGNQIFEYFLRILR